jgi:multicomponent Na+:H+ antiporter subunit B
VTLATRKRVFLVAVAGLGALLVWGLTGLPDFGHEIGRLGTRIAHAAPAERHVTAAVSAVNFDYRAFDTLGEEFILFTAVLGVTLVLRAMRGERELPQPGEAEEHRFAGASDALRGLALAFTGGLLVLGGYVVAHGAITPGGGFQGGVILAAASFMVFLAGEYMAMRRVAPQKLAELGEAAGAAGFVLIGIGGLIFAGVFMENFLRLGKPGELVSAGTIPLISVSIGFAVAGAFVVLWSEFLDQAIPIRSGGDEG